MVGDRVSPGVVRRTAGFLLGSGTDIALISRDAATELKDVVVAVPVSGRGPRILVFMRRGDGFEVRELYSELAVSLVATLLFMDGTIRAPPVPLWAASRTFWWGDVEVVQRDKLRLGSGERTIFVRGKRTGEFIKALAAWTGYYLIVERIWHLLHHPPATRPRSLAEVPEGDRLVLLAHILVNPVVRITPGGRILINGFPANEVMGEVRYLKDGPGSYVVSDFLLDLDNELNRELSTFFKLRGVGAEVKVTSSHAVLVFRGSEVPLDKHSFTLVTDDLKEHLVNHAAFVNTLIANRDFVLSLVTDCDSVSDCPIEKILDAVTILADPKRLAEVLVEKGLIRVRYGRLFLMPELVTELVPMAKVVKEAARLLGLSNYDAERVGDEYAKLGVMALHLKRSEGVAVVAEPPVREYYVVRHPPATVSVWPEMGTVVIVLGSGVSPLEIDIDGLVGDVAVALAKKMVRTHDPVKLWRGSDVVLEGSVGDVLKLARKLADDIVKTYEKVIIGKVWCLSGLETIELINRIAARRALVTLEGGIIRVDGVPYVKIVNALAEGENHRFLEYFRDFVYERLPRAAVRELKERVREKLAGGSDEEVMKADAVLTEKVISSIITVQGKLDSGAPKDAVMEYLTLFVLASVGVNHVLSDLLMHSRLTSDGSVIIEPLSQEPSTDSLLFVETAMSKGCEAAPGGVKCDPGSLLKILNEYLATGREQVLRASTLPVLVRNSSLRKLLEEIIKGLESGEDIEVDDVLWSVATDDDALKEIDKLLEVKTGTTVIDETARKVLDILQELRQSLEKISLLYKMVALKQTEKR